MKLEAELKIEEPKPNILPVTVSAVFAGLLWVFELPKPNSPADSGCAAALAWACLAWV